MAVYFTLDARVLDGLTTVATLPPRFLVPVAQLVSHSTSRQVSFHGSLPC